MSFHKEYKPFHDPELHTVTNLDRLKAWNGAGAIILGFCDAENCHGKQPCKRIEPGLFVCKKHFYAMVK